MPPSPLKRSTAGQPATASPPPSPIKRPPSATPVTAPPVKRPAPVLSPVPGVKKSASPATPATPSGNRSGYDPSKDKLLGTVLGKCKLVKHIGKGGMGDVYLGEHTLLQKKVAVKVLPGDFTRNEELVSRFRREAVAAARLEHPNIVQVHDIGSERDTHYIIMQFVEGKSLQDRLDETTGPFDIKEACRILADTARGLGAAHKAGIVHRDVKPANVLLSDKGEVKITDFGLAHDQESQSLITMPGAMMGTPHFMSPEQAEGRVADQRSDIYAMGVMIYYLVTGRRPFTGESHMAVLFKHINEDPVPAKKINPAVPDPLQRVIAKCMAKRPELRYQNCDQLAAELDAAARGGPGTSSTQGVRVPGAAGRLSQHGQPASRRSTVESQAPRAGKKNNQLVLAVSIGGLVLVAGILALVILLKKDKPGAAGPTATPETVADGDSAADRKLHDLLAKAKEAFEAGQYEPALKIIEQARGIRDTREVTELGVKIARKQKEQKAAAGFEDLRKLAANAMADPEERLAALKAFREEFPDLRAADVSALVGAVQKELDEATSFQPEDGFTAVPVDSLVLTNPEGAKAKVGRGGMYVQWQAPAAVEKYYNVLRTPKDYTDCVLRFDMAVGRPGGLCIAYRYHDSAFHYHDFQDSQLVAGWIPVELQVQAGRVQVRVNQGSPYSKGLEDAAAPSGAVGVAFKTGSEFRIRNVRVKSLKSRPPPKHPGPDVTPPDPAADLAEKTRRELAYVQASLADDAKSVQARKYDEILARLAGLQVETPAARQAIAALRTRIDGADRTFKAFLSALGGLSEGETITFKTTGSPAEQKGRLVKLVNDKVEMALGNGGKLSLTTREFHAESIVAIAGRRSREASPAHHALFAIADGNPKLAQDLLFNGKKLRVDPASCEPVVETLLLAGEITSFALPPKDQQALVEAFLGARDQLKGTKVEARLEALAVAAGAAKLDDVAAAIGKLAEAGKHDEARSRFAEFARANPTYPGMTALANAVFPSLMAKGWKPAWNSPKDVETSNRTADKLKIGDDELVWTGEPSDGNTVRVETTTGASGLSADLLANEGASTVCLLTQFRSSDDWTWFFLEGGKAKLGWRRGGPVQKKELAEVAEPGSGVPVTLTAIHFADRSWFFVNGKLVLTAAPEFVDLAKGGGFHLEDGTAAIRRPRRWVPE